MKHLHDEFTSLGDVNQSIDTTKKRKGWRRVLAFLDQPIWSVSATWTRETGQPTLQGEASLDTN